MSGSVQATVTKYHGLSGLYTTESYFVLEAGIQDQGARMAGFW